jgi:serine/threonine protein kinase
MDVLGAGSYGKVCHYKENYIKKHIPIEHLWDCVFEFVILKSIQCPNLIYANDILLSESEIQVVCPNFGRSLECFNFNDFNIQNKLRLLQDVSLGLATLHNVNILHGDIKPENVLFDEKSNSSRVCDFGMSRKLFTSKQSKILYSVKYRPPECWLYSKSEINLSSDVWAFGMLILSILTGVYPIHFHGDPKEKENLINYILSTCILYDYLSGLLDDKNDPNLNSSYLEIISNMIKKYQTEYDKELQLIKSKSKNKFIKEEFIHSINELSKNPICLILLKLCLKCMNIDNTQRLSISDVLKEIHSSIKTSNLKALNRKDLIPLKKPSGVCMFNSSNIPIEKTILKTITDTSDMNALSDQDKFLLMVYLISNDWKIEL